MFSTLGMLECHNPLQPPWECHLYPGALLCTTSFPRRNPGICTVPMWGFSLLRSPAEVLALTLFGVTAMTHVFLSVVLSDAFLGSCTELAAL